MADQCEAVDVQHIGQREYVADKRLGRIVRDIGRPVARPEASKVGHDQPDAVLEQRRNFPPGPVRLRKSVQQDGRRRVLQSGQRDIHRDAGGKGQALLPHQG